VHVKDERLFVWAEPGNPQPLRAISRDAAECRVFDQAQRKLVPVNVPDGQLALVSFGVTAQRAIDRVIKALEGIQVHLPFDVQANWASREIRRESALRSAAHLARATELGRIGENLAICYYSFKNDRGPREWERVLDRVRAGLGLDLVDIIFPSAAAGQIELALQYRGSVHKTPARHLADGQLAFLGMVALSELGAHGSLVAIDEPESHLHPDLVVRACGLLHNLSRNRPVIVATHSDRFLDAVPDPAHCVLLCELDELRQTRLLRPDEKSLEEWLQSYRGLGEIRQQGYERQVMSEPVAEEPDDPDRDL
jgi:hypothetical protein